MKQSRLKLPEGFTGPHPQRQELQIVDCRSAYERAVNEGSPLCLYRKPPELALDNEAASFIRKKGNSLCSTKNILKVDDDGNVQWHIRHDAMPDCLVPHIEEQAKMFRAATGERGYLLSEFPAPTLSYARGPHIDNSDGQIYVYRGIGGTDIPVDSNNKTSFRSNIGDICYIKSGEVHETPNPWFRVVHVVCPLRQAARTMFL